MDLALQIELFSAVIGELDSDGDLTNQHIGENGAAEPDYDSFDRSRRNRYGYDEDPDDEEADEDASFSAATVDDNWQYVDQWRDTEDRVAESAADG